MSVIEQRLSAFHSKTATPSPSSPPPSRSPSPSLHASLDRSRPQSQQHFYGMRLAHGIPIPSHMLPPLEDGYRTPLGEDYEYHFRNRAYAERRQIDGPTQSFPGHFYPLPPPSARSRLSIIAITEKLEEKLAWRRRIRHFTWNFFSLTMATVSVVYLKNHMRQRLI